MKHKEIVSLIKKRFEKINFAFECVRLHFSENDIRLFRVKVKKLQAYLRMINAGIDHQDTLKVPRRILKYYEISGTIRSLQIQHLRIHQTSKAEKNDLPQTYLNLISDHLLNQLEKASKFRGGQNAFLKEEEKLLVIIPAKISPKSIEHFVRSEIKALEKLLTPVFPTDQSIHETRKLLKGLLYTLIYIQEYIDMICPYGLLSNEENIDAFSKVLGKFHDIDTAISLLHTGVSSLEIDENEKLMLRKLETTWIKDKEAARLEVYRYLQNINASIQTLQAVTE
jgi:hypothetical protein